MRHADNGNWQGWEGNPPPFNPYPPWQQHHAAHPHPGMQHPWGHGQPPPQWYYSEMDQFHAAYHSDRFSGPSHHGNSIMNSNHGNSGMNPHQGMNQFQTPCQSDTANRPHPQRTFTRWDKTIGITRKSDRLNGLPPTHYSEEDRNVEEKEKQTSAVSKKVLKTSGPEKLTPQGCAGQTGPKNKNPTSSTRKLPGPIPQFKTCSAFGSQPYNSERKEQASIGSISSKNHSHSVGKKPINSSSTTGKASNNCSNISEPASKVAGHSRSVLGKGGSSRGGFSVKPSPLYRKNTPKKNKGYNDDEDETNEINHWLRISKGNESVQGKEDESVIKDPLPGSEEARNNAIKEATDRLKQALKQKKNVNLNELLSSGDESKGDNNVQSKTKSHPKNLAQLELDASDMREIGRANTEKANCNAEENSDDDIVVLERSPSPERLIIDLDITPIKDSNCHDPHLTGSNGLHSLTRSRKSRENSLEFEETGGSRQRNDQHEDHCQSPGSSSDSTVILENQLSSEISAESRNIPEDSLGRQVESSQNKCNASVMDSISRSLSPAKATNALETSRGGSQRSRVASDLLSRKPNVPTDCTADVNVTVISGIQSSSVSSRLSTVENSESSERRTGNISSSPFSPPARETLRRRRASSSSSSSAHESPSPCSSLKGSRMARHLQPRSSNSNPRSPPMLSRSSYDSHQKKIISDLQKISQNKLRDLINNPRSGKLDFAMRELMKEHRAVLSRISRDTAEKRIPAEFLNPKSSDLPPDDGALLADFAIDWSSLPGELISSLGDLFQNFNSDDDGSTANQQDNTKSTADETASSVNCVQQNSTNIGDNIVDVYTQNSNFQSQLCQEGSNRTRNECEDTEKKTDRAQSVRIRVREFARENLLLLRPDNEVQSHQTNHSVENLDGNTVSESINITSLSAASIEEIQENSSTTKESGDTISESSGSNSATETTEKISNKAQDYSVKESSRCKETRRFEDHDEEVCNLSEDPNSKGRQRNVSKRLNNLFSKGTSHKTNKSARNITPGEKEKHQKKQRKQVNLEELNWTEESSLPSNELSQVDVVSSNAQELGNNSSVVNACRAEDDVLSLNTGNNIDNIDKQGLSMLPVLMMTVPANEVSGVVCNMTSSEMEKRIAEIDELLQNLVQERFDLAQALKNSQFPLQSDEGMSNTTPELRNTELSSERNAVNSNSTIDSTVIHLKTPTHIFSNEGGQAGKQPLSSSDVLGKRNKIVKRKHDSADDSLAHAKRKRSSELLQQPKPSGDSHPTSGAERDSKDSDIQSKVSSIKNSQPEGNQVRSEGEKVTELIVLDDTEDDCPVSGRMQPEGVLGQFLAKPPPCTFLNNIEGNILDMKIQKRSIYAASQSGQVYWIRACGELLATFGTKHTSGVTCIEFPGHAKLKHLYAGGGDGVLRAYEVPLHVPRKEVVMPMSTYNISNAIHCMEASGSFLYIGTKAGTVIPFDLVKLKAREPLNIGGFPVLAIRTCNEGPRKVIVVSCRHQPITIRDASSGLLLRSLGGSDWTVYNLVLYKNMVFCGANTEYISVFNFQTGKAMHSLKAGKGVIDMKLFNDFLFCGCYNGKIYLFNLKTNTYVGCMDGPGNKMILCLNIFKKKIVCSSKDIGMVSYSLLSPVWKALCPVTKTFPKKKKLQKKK